MWQLIEEQGLKYFKFEFEGRQFLYSTVTGTEKFLEKFSPIFLKQIHSDIIVNVDKDSVVAGDGLMTDTTTPIGVKIADCLPVYMFDEERIMILHCGWRSLIKGIVKRAKGFLKDYKYCLGACIGPCCYEVKSDVVAIFNQNYPSAIIERKGGNFLDLKSAVMCELGREKCIGNLQYCTYCRPDLFYSFRHGDKDKRNYAVIMFNKP